MSPIYFFENLTYYAEENIELFDDDGLTPLMWASAYGQYPIVDALLHSSVGVDVENPKGQTALLFAAFGGYHEVVRLLVSEGADVNHRDQVKTILLQKFFFSN